MTFFSIRNFGCRVNQAEAFAWAEDFQGRGLRPAAEPGRGDLVVVNTCTLTARADREALKFIRKTAADSPGSRIVVTGCLAERAADDLARMPGVWRIIPNAEKEGLTEAALYGWPGSGPEVSAARPRARAFLKIQDGCDRACAYCIIPSVRGRSRSTPPERVREAVAGLAARGYREVVLSGIHLSSYGRDLEPRASLAGLLAGLQAGGDGPWLRLSSLDPRLVPAVLLSALASSRRLQPHFHLSLQHGSDAVLAAMRRAPAAAENEALLGRIEAAVPEAAIGADILVGFPGETPDDFQRTMDMVERSPLTYVHVFAFSPRPGTPAAAMPQVDGAVRKQRAVRLRALSRRKSAAFRRRFLGRVLDGIVIKAAPDGAEVLTGNAIEVEAAGPCPARGEDARVRITAVDGERARGKVVS
jgi:threonylcarbamoyladenosine tRNA methylthiotransferase MtaB